MRRTFWLAMGLGAGATGAVMASRWVRRQARRMAPPNLARQFGRTVQDLGAVAQLVRGGDDSGASSRTGTPPGGRDKKDDKEAASSTNAFR